MICCSSPDSISTCNWLMEEDLEQLYDINYVKDFCNFGFSSSLKSHFLMWPGRREREMVTHSAGLSEADLCMVEHLSAASAFPHQNSDGILTRYPQVYWVSSTWSGLCWITLMLLCGGQSPELSFAGPPVQPCLLRPGRKFKYSFQYWCWKLWAGAENSTPKTE